MGKKKNKTYVDELKKYELGLTQEYNNSVEESEVTSKKKITKVKRLVSKLLKKLWPIVEKAVKDSLKVYLEKELQNKLK